ncbi:MAG: OmpA family protein [Deltaproteobacteria bacterium]|nr:OmpA family protein [Deltaproteobacteria bacterium]
MNKIAALLLGLLCLALSAAAAPDKPGCVDHPLFPTRMPDYRLSDCTSKEFDGYEFFAVKGPKHREEGKFTFLTYAIDDRKKEQSGLAVVRNFENAITKIGGTIAASDPQRWVNGQITVDGKQVWVQAEKGNGLIWLRIVEKTAMQQHIVADAASFGNELRSAGHAAVYGILFDTGKAEIKPESAQAIGEVGKLLKAEAGLKVFVVGHTDGVGGVDANLKLSQARAEAVVQALVRDHGIAAARLLAHGSGPFAPVATNDTDEGRAKNRRVELVKQ